MTGVPFTLLYPGGYRENKNRGFVWSGDALPRLGSGRQGPAGLLPSGGATGDGIRDKSWVP